jgi:hypothetical protein
MPGSRCRNRAGTCRTTGAGDRVEGDGAEGEADEADEDGAEAEEDGAGGVVQPATARTATSGAATLARCHRRQVAILR